MVQKLLERLTERFAMLPADSLWRCLEIPIAAFYKNSNWLSLRHKYSSVDF